MAGITKDEFGEVSETKVLRLEDEEVAYEACSLSRKGAIRAVKHLPIRHVEEVFQHTPPAEILGIVNTINEEIEEMPLEEKKEEVGELFQKTGILLDTAVRNSGKPKYTAGEGGNYGKYH